MHDLARRSHSSTYLALAAGVFAASVLSASAAEARRPTFEVTVERHQLINVTGASARIRMVVRVGWLECKSNPSPSNSNHISQTFVRVAIATRAQVRVRGQQLTAIGVVTAGRQIRRFQIPRFVCNRSVFSSPHLLFRRYTVDIVIKNLRQRTQYYVAPCLSAWGMKKARTRTVRLKCASLIPFKTPTNWKSTDVQFVRLIANRTCGRGGKPTLRLIFKNAGLGPVTKPFQVWFSYKQSDVRGEWSRHVLTIRSRIRPGKSTTQFVRLSRAAGAPYVGRIRIDPHGRLATLGENRANNSAGPISFTLPSGCRGGSAGYDLSVSNIRFPRGVCGPAFRFALSNRGTGRVPLLRINTLVQAWIDNRQVINSATWYPNHIRSRRAVTLRHPLAGLPSNRRYQLRIRVMLYPRGNPADGNAGNNVTERTFNCDPTRR